MSTVLWELYCEYFDLFLRPADVRRAIRVLHIFQFNIHGFKKRYGKCLKVWPPPNCQKISDTAVSG